MAIAVALVAAAAFVGADVADAKRMGGGRTLGAQRQATPAPAAPSSPNVAPSSPSAPVQATPAKPAAAPAAPAASGASRWLGPIAGLAAGLGLAALLSHFGLSESFASFLLIALLVVGGVFVVRMLLSRRTQPARPLQYAGAGANAGTPPRVEPTLDPAPAAPARFEPVMGATTAGPAPTAATGRFPPGFDAAAFADQAKLQFRKLQSAYDEGDRKALAEVMTPEMFKEISGELAQRGTHLPTEVMRLDASVVDVATEGDSHWVSVHFTGLLREDGTVLPKEFDEVWNLTKPVDGSSGWLLAGIQQTA
jgi:predicted lipid-binding transport protein (Tim44 family)